MGTATSAQWAVASRSEQSEEPQVCNVSEMSMIRKICEKWVPQRQPSGLLRAGASKVRNPSRAWSDPSRFPKKNAQNKSSPVQNPNERSASKKPKAPADSYPQSQLKSSQTPKASSNKQTHYALLSLDFPVSRAPRAQPRAYKTRGQTPQKDAPESASKIEKRRGPPRSGPSLLLRTEKQISPSYRVPYKSINESRDPQKGRDISQNNEIKLRKNDVVHKQNYVIQR